MNVFIATTHLCGCVFIEWDNPSLTENKVVLIGCDCDKNAMILNSFSVKQNCGLS